MKKLTLDDVIVHSNPRKGFYVAAVKMSACIPDQSGYILPEGATDDLRVLRGGQWHPVHSFHLRLPMNRSGQRMCEVCGEPFVERTSPGKPIYVCSRLCRRKRHNAVSAAAERAKYQPKTPAPVACALCGTLHTPKRSDALYCSVRCRVAAHRAGRKG